MRVLHVSPSFYPALMYGGPVMALYQLCLSQLAAGHLVTVLTSDAAGAQLVVSTQGFGGTRAVPNSVRVAAALPTTTPRRDGSRGG